MWSLGGKNPGGKIQLLRAISGGVIEQEERTMQQKYYQHFLVDSTCFLNIGAVSFKFFSSSKPSKRRKPRIALQKNGLFF